MARADRRPMTAFQSDIEFGTNTTGLLVGNLLHNEDGTGLNCLEKLIRTTQRRAANSRRVRHPDSALTPRLESGVVSIHLWNQ